MYHNPSPAIGAGIGGGVLAHTGGGMTPMMALWIALAAFALIAAGAALARTVRHATKG